MLIAVFGNFNPANKFHHKIGPAGFGRTGIEYLRDAGIVHQCERLSFSFKPGYDTLRVHARLDNLQGHPSTNRLFLFGDEYDAAASFSDLLQQLVPVDQIPGLFPGTDFGPRLVERGSGRCFQEPGGSLIGPEQVLDPSSQVLVASADPIQKGNALPDRKLNGFREHFDIASRVAHRRSLYSCGRAGHPSPQPRLTFAGITAIEVPQTAPRYAHEPLKLFDFVEQPGTGEHPIVLNRGNGNSEDPGNFLIGQARKIAQFDQLGLDWMLQRKFFQCFIHRQ